MNKIKAQAIEFIKAAPDNNISSLEDVLREIHFKMQVDKGMTEIDKGLGIPHKEAKARLGKWLKD